MKLVSIQSSAFKAVFEVLKDIRNDVNVYFTDKGMRILTLDTARVALVDMFLAAENFEEYTCPSPIVAGKSLGAEPLVRISFELVGITSGSLASLAPHLVFCRH